MRSAFKMSQKCFKPHSILAPFVSMMPQMLRSHSQRFDISNSLHDTSGTIQSCSLQIQALAFLSSRRGPTRTLSPDYAPEWTRHAQICSRSHQSTET